MTFVDSLLTEDLEPLRDRLLYHPLWEGVIDGTLDRSRLALFALQDYWLVRQAYRLDALAIATAEDLALQEELASKLGSKIGGYKMLIPFGKSFGLSDHDFETVEPIAGCMALTTYFYWMLSYGSAGEKIAAVGASEAIFVKICQRVGPALERNYHLTPEQVAFFPAHDQIAEEVHSVDEAILARFTTPKDRQLITRAVRLSHEFELLFYDTIMAAPLPALAGSDQSGSSIH